MYNVSYDHPTSYNELVNLKKTCNSNSIICVAGSQNGSDTLILISCGNCMSILSDTKVNHPIKVNGAYWYLTHPKSFGFSSKFLIEQKDCDVFDCENDTCTDSKRLCWHIGGSSGGWRLGSLVYKKNNFNFRKIIFLKH